MTDALEILALIVAGLLALVAFEVVTLAVRHFTGMSYEAAVELCFGLICAFVFLSPVWKR